VDDDPGMLRAAARVLGQHYAVLCAENAQAALEAAVLHRPDVAVVDIRLPEMNGFELMRRLQAAQPDLDVILMTGNAEEPDANLVQAIDAGAFYFIQKPFDRRVLLALVGRCLELRRLRREKQHYVERLETELEEARRFQQSLLPPFESRLRGVSLSARYVACRELAGDFYDYVALDGTGAAGRAVAMIIADVVGHGASAAMMTGIVKSAFHAAGAEGFDPLCVVERVKDGIRPFDASRFITLCCARLEVDAGRLEYVNAGHPPPVLRRDRESILLETTAPLISSALLDLPCDKASLAVQAGDVVLFYTDGVTEAEGKCGMFGQSRIIATLSQSGLQGTRLLDELLAKVTEFADGRPINDDMTLLVAEF
jgi:sigma-B regulation protein RsbU (phosphoserine phosphatase)